MKIGDQIPDLTLPDQNGQPIRLHDFIGKNPLVIFFYPKDNTPGCTREACSFRDSYHQFQAAGAHVIGISTDSVDSHRQFADSHQLTYLLLSDTAQLAQQAFHVPRNLFGLLPGRVTYVTDIHGIVLHIYDSALQPRHHVREALRVLQSPA
ncbi:MAG: peroxiredoxin [Cyclobacteriaceae bacterium]|nr:peroxiredoxin [Cyclobacteriaceae bacterium]